LNVKPAPYTGGVTKNGRGNDMLKPFCDGICGHEIKQGEIIHKVVLMVNERPVFAGIFCDSCHHHNELPVRSFVKRMTAQAGGQNVQGVDSAPAEPSRIILPGGA